MTDALTVIVITAMVLATLSSILVIQMWRLRNTWPLSVREVPLLMITGIGSIVPFYIVGALILLKHNGVEVPCLVTLWLSYSMLNGVAIANMIRGAKLLIVTNKDMREKFGSYVRTNRLFGYCALLQLNFWGIALVTMFVRPCYRQRKNNCDFFYEAPVIEAMCLSGVYIIWKVVQILKQVDDAFGISQEIRRFISWTPLLGVYFLIVSYGFAPFMDYFLFPRGAVVLLCSIINLVNSFAIPLRDYYRSKRSGATRVYLDESFHGSHSCTATSIEELLHWSDVELAFSRFASLNLCGESADFLHAVGVYQAACAAQLATLYGEYLDVCKLYLSPGAASEVNISARTRKLSLCYANDRDAYDRLTAQERAKVFDAARREVVNIMDTNLLNKFKQTAEFQAMYSNIAALEHAEASMEAGRTHKSATASHGTASGLFDRKTLVQKISTHS